MSKRITRELTKKFKKITAGDWEYQELAAEVQRSHGLKQVFLHWLQE